MSLMPACVSQKPYTQPLMEAPEVLKEESGHGYFRNSPWVSSDVLANPGLDMTPKERGLVRQDNKIFWSFPEDYIERLRLALKQRIFERA